MIECAEELISEYIDGELLPAVARELEEHFRTCADCRATLSEYCSLLAATRLLAERTHGAGGCRQGATGVLHYDGFGQARTSDLLA